MASTPNTSSLPYAYVATTTAKSASSKNLNRQTAQSIRQQNHKTDTFESAKTEAPFQVLPLTVKEQAELSKNPLKQTQLLEQFTAFPSVDAKGQTLETPQSRLAMFHRLNQQLPAECLHL